MKMTLNNIIARSQEILLEGDFHQRMHSNDKEVVYYSSLMIGSDLDKRHNDILMNRNDVPNHWKSHPYLSDCMINFSFKKAYIQVAEYIRQYNITPGRMTKMLNILSVGRPEFSKVGKKYAGDKNLLRHLGNVNELRNHLNEMTPAEIYDFSFDMAYDFIDEFFLSEATLSLSLIIMYWIQRECNLIPLAVRCSKDVFLTTLEMLMDETFSENEKKRRFRLFMRKVLNLHLRLFIKNAKDGEKKTSRDRILDLIKNNPYHTAKTMASSLGLSVPAVQKQIVKLKTEKRLERIGPDNGGRWKVIKQYHSNDESLRVKEY